MNRHWWLLIIVTLILSSFVDHKLLLLIGLLLGLVAVAVHLWTRFCLTGVSYNRRFAATRLDFGQETDLFVEVTNAKPLLLPWMITVDEFPGEVTVTNTQLYGSGNPRRRLLVNSLSLRWYERVTRRYHLRAERRGVWEFGPVQISSGDLFGFAINRTTVAAVQQIIVYPKYVPLTTLGFPSLNPFGDFATPRRFLDDPLRLVGVREYLPGDNFRHIHWKASARQSRLQTKVFEPSANRTLALFLDARTALYANEGIDRDMLELAISTTASVAHWGWARGYPVGLFVNTIRRDSRSRIRLRPEIDPHQFSQILEALARMEDDGQWTLNTLLKTEATRLVYGTAIVVVTALPNDALYKTLLELARRDYGVTMVTLGTAPPQRKLPGVRQYHVGGREIWHALAGLALA